MATRFSKSLSRVLAGVGLEVIAAITVAIPVKPFVFLLMYLTGHGPAPEDPLLWLDLAFACVPLVTGVAGIAYITIGLIGLCTGPRLE